MGRRDQRVGLRLLAAAASLACPIAVAGPAAAQTAPVSTTPVSPATQVAPAPPSREELNPAARITPSPSLQRDLFAVEPAGPCPLRGSDLRFTLQSVSFQGVTALSARQLEPAYDGLIGAGVPVSTVCDIRDRATRLLFNRGVLARVEIPEQRITGGALVLQVIEARVVNVRIRGDAGHAQAAVERYLDKLRGMTPFDMRKAQRYLLLASDIPGVQVRAAIRPSAAGERGAVDLDVTVAASHMAVTGNVQNLESRSIGRFGGLVRVDVETLTDFGERTSVVGYHTLDTNEQFVVQLLEEARVGGDGMILRGSLVYGETRPGGPVADLDLKSTSFVAEAEAAYPLIRLRRRNLNLAGGFDAIDESTDASGLLLYRDKLRVFYLRTDGDYRLDALSRVFQFAGSATFRKGVEGLGSSERYSDTLTRPDGEPGAWLVRGSARVATVLVDKLQVSAQLQGQYSPDPLLDYEQLALGDLTIGRGYDPAVVLGDSGLSGAFELRYGPLPLHRLILAQPYAFYDAGYVHDNSVSVIKNRTLTSAGAGVLLRLGARFNLDLTYAKPFQAPLPGRPRPTPRLLLNLTASIL